jgi:thiol:disulfide interchange protein DsbA
VKKYFFCEARYLTAILAVIGIALMVFYVYCETSCRYLTGSILGLDLKYLGMVYMGVVLLLCFTGGRKLLPLLLSFGIGAEVFLVGYQVTTGVYCPYCLAFAAIVVLMFAINFDRAKIGPMIVSLLAGLALFSLLFTGSLTPAYAEDNLITSFGRGPVSVRIYTDYFCGPCNSLEGDLGKVIDDLMRKKKIRLTFIDTPIHRETPIYAKYFLYILNEKRDFKHALAARAALFAAAEAGIKNPGELESFLAKKGFTYRRFDVKDTLGSFEKYLREDRINSTPTCVIYVGNERQTFTGANKILKALKRLSE